MKEFNDEEYFLLKALAGEVVDGIAPALERIKKMCEMVIAEVESVDKMLENAVSGFDVNKYSKMSQEKQTKLIRLLAIKNRIEMLLNRNKSRIAFIDKILLNEGLLNHSVNHKKLNETYKTEVSNICEETLNLNLIEENISKENIFFENEILEIIGGKLSFENSLNANVLKTASEDFISKIIRIYPDSVATIPVEILLDTKTKKKILKAVSTYVIDETKHKDIKVVNKELGSLLEFKTEITTTPEAYMIGVMNMFNSMIKAHLLKIMPEKTEQIQSKLKCNEKSELIPESKRMEILSAVILQNVAPESEKMRIAREKEILTNASNSTYLSQIRNEQTELEKLKQEKIENQNAQEIENVLKNNNETIERQNVENVEIEPEMQTLSKNKYDD